MVREPKLGSDFHSRQSLQKRVVGHISCLEELTGQYGQDQAWQSSSGKGMWCDLSYRRLRRIPAGDEAVRFDVCGAGFAATQEEKPLLAEPTYLLIPQAQVSSSKGIIVKQTDFSLAHSAWAQEHESRWLKDKRPPSSAEVPGSESS